MDRCLKKFFLVVSRLILRLTSHFDTIAER